MMLIAAFFVTLQKVKYLLARDMSINLSLLLQESLSIS